MRVSVLIPCYNAAPYVRAAVESVLNQTWTDIEVIAVNDGSTDGTADVLESIKDSRLKVVHQKNSGQCAAANHAFALSTGELIKFFDADDIMAPDLVALQVARLNGSQSAIAMSEWARFYGDEHEMAKFVPLTAYRDAKPVDWLASEWMNARPMMQCGIWLIPRSVLERSGLWDERLSLINDFEFFTRVLTNATEILYTPGARLFYRSGIASSLSGRKTRAAVESAYLSLTLATSHLLGAENSERTRRACANVFQDFEYWHYPDHADLRAKARARVAELGGADLAPDGPPGFQKLRPWIGWKAARLAQLAAQRLRANRAAPSI